MIGLVLVLSALVALIQARAIVTNLCPYNVYVWSIPQVLSSSNTNNIPIRPGGQYLEPWRHGSTTNPGIAIKISPQADGVLKRAGEIDFAYKIDHVDMDLIWVDLSPVRGEPFQEGLSFHTCHAHYNSTDVRTHTCNATDDIELVLCGSGRTTAPQDYTPLDQIQACYDYHHVCGGANYPPCKPVEDSDSDDETESESDDETDSDSSLAPVSEQCPTTCTPPTTVTVHHTTTVFDPQRTLYTPPSTHKACPDCAKPVILSPCLAKVVYPARRARSPLLPRVTPSSTITQRDPSSSLCSIVRKYHPQIDDCDEEAMQAYARELYPNICESEHEPLLLGVPCNEVMEELRNLYPDVINTAKGSGPNYQADCQCGSECKFCAHFNSSCFCADPESFESVATGAKGFQTRSTPFFNASVDKVCLSWFCEPSIPGIDCDDVYVLLYDLFKIANLDLDQFVDDDEAENCLPLPHVAVHDQFIVCIAPLCAKIGLEGTVCQIFAAVMERASNIQFDTIASNVERIWCP
ncbi:hypothetical protein BDW02DRAFT_369656 [Decorospora gaudefroyi]|uniref:Uncharacterized protein n=1 Tax=Decorospora gaudefroyi TaxID=184978 RepID=A0A6A5K7F3_9PLEO|nr:hypothetical protein BDW02DRAFT_369656 [Decorospora gaudefroyi]